MAGVAILQRLTRLNPRERRMAMILGGVVGLSSSSGFRSASSGGRLAPLGRRRAPGRARRDSASARVDSGAPVEEGHHRRPLREARAGPRRLHRGARAGAEARGGRLGRSPGDSAREEVHGAEHHDPPPEGGDARDLALPRERRVGGVCGDGVAPRYPPAPGGARFVRLRGRHLGLRSLGKLPASRLQRGYTMKERLKALAPKVGLPLFYLFALALFARWTFPYDKLRDRIVLSFNQQQRESNSQQELKIDELGPSWWSLAGINAKGVRLLGPPSEPGKPPSELKVDEARANISLFGLLLREHRPGRPDRRFRRHDQGGLRRRGRRRSGRSTSKRFFGPQAEPRPPHEGSRRRSGAG